MRITRVDCELLHVPLDRPRASPLEAAGGQVAEGVVSCRSVRDLAVRHKVDMPITEAVYQVCYRHLPPTQMMRYLMEAPHSAE